MLHAPRHRPRPPHWRVPVACAVLVLFMFALWTAEGASKRSDPTAPAAPLAPVAIHDGS